MKALFVMFTFSMFFCNSSVPSHLCSSIPSTCVVTTAAASSVLTHPNLMQVMLCCVSLVFFKLFCLPFPYLQYRATGPRSMCADCIAPLDDRFSALSFIVCARVCPPEWYAINLQIIGHYGTAGHSCTGLFCVCVCFFFVISLFSGCSYVGKGSFYY